MHLVIDTNVLISALLAKSTTYEIILFGDLELIVPEYSLEEIERNREELQKRMKIDENQFFIVLNLLLSHVTIVPRAKYKDREEKAKQITPDLKDFPFFALAIAKGIPLWSNEGKLKQQKEVTVYNTKDVLSFLR